MHCSTSAMRQFTIRTSRRCGNFYAASFSRELNPPQTALLKAAVPSTPAKLYHVSSFGGGGPVVPVSEERDQGDQGDGVAVSALGPMEEKDGACMFAKPFYRKWTPPHTTTLQEASSYAPKALYREDSYAEYVAPKEEHDLHEYACFGVQLVASDFNKGLTKPFYRKWTPPHTTALQEASSYAPKKLYREDSYAEYIDPKEEHDHHEYACFGAQLVADNFDEGPSTSVTAAPAEQETVALDGVWHPQDWASELLLSGGPTDAATYAGGSARPTLSRGKSFASYAGELNARANKARTRDDAVSLALDTKPTKIKKTAATWHPSWQLQASLTEQGFKAAPSSSSSSSSRASLSLHEGYAGVSGKAPALRRGKSFASYAGELDPSDMGWRAEGKALGMVPSTVNWQPSWHLQVSPMRQGARAAASYSSHAMMANKQTKRLSLSVVTKRASPLPEHPFDECDGSGWGTPRCPVP